MLNKIIAFSIKQKVIVGFLTLCLIIFGGYYVTKLPIDAVPDITNNQVQIITVSPSLGAPDVERLITFQIEMACNNIPGLVEMRSFSRFGLSLITLVFEDSKDIYLARQQVAERLQTAKESIPAGVGIPELAPVTTGLGEIYQYYLRPLPGFEEKYTEIELRTIQDWIVRRQLLGVEGVADVSSFGGKLKQYEVAVDVSKLQSYGLGIADVFEAIEKNNENAGGAYIEKENNALFIRTDGLAKNIDDIENITIKQLQNSLPVLIKDVAKVQFGNAVRYGAMVYNGKYEVAGAVVMMLKGSNSNHVVKRVKERIEQIKKTLPKGVVLEPFLDRSKMVDNAINTVKTNLIEGALIVIFVLVLFLGNLRAGLLVASVIPLSMMFAVILMHIFDVSGNLMSLGALDFGLIVDGAVIIVETILHSLFTSKMFHTGFSQEQMNNLVERETGKMLNSTVFAQAIILIVYLPIFTLKGIEGKMFLPMAQTVSFALIGAFILSLTYVPMMASLVLKNGYKQHFSISDKLISSIERRYMPLLQIALNHKKIVLTITFLLFIISGIILSRLGGEFIPTLEEGDFAVETRILTGSNLNTSIDVAKKASKILLNEFEEVEKVVSKIGSGEIPTDPMPIEAQDLMVILKDKKHWKNANSFDELAEKMNHALSKIPGATFGFQYPVQMRFNELMTGARQDVICKIYGEDLTSLTMYANKLGAIAKKIEGAKDVWVEPIGGMPQIVITYKRNLMSAYGVNVTEINHHVQTAFAGKAAGNIFEGEKRFELVVRLQLDERQSLNDVKNLLIKTHNNQYIPLQQLADIELIEGPNQIQRDAAKRRIIVGFNVRNRDIQSVVNELQQKVSKNINLQPGYYITYGGSFKNLIEAKERLLVAVPVSLLLIFFMLYIAFRSVKQALLIYTAIPLSAMGGIFALFVRGMPFSISAGIGFIALFGVAVLNGIVLIAEFNRQLKNNNLYDSIINGTKTRLRPVIITASVASLGFLPMALSNGAGAEVQRPLATVVIGGLIIATLLTLIILPVLFSLFHQKNNSTKIASVIIIFIFSLYQNNASAQTITLQQALDSAAANNLLVKEKLLQFLAKQELAKTAWQLPKTDFDFEYGQFNSYFNDNRFSVKQQFNFPTVYTKAKKMFNAEALVSKQMMNVELAGVKKEICNIFINYKNAFQKQQLLKQADSLYTVLEKLTSLRLTTGDINKQDYSLAKTQLVSIKQQLKQTETDMVQLIYALKLLTGNTILFTPDVEQLIIDINETENPVTTNADVLLSKQLKTSAEARYKLSKQSLLPDFLIGYSSLTIFGYGNDEKFYSYDTRFNVITAGIAVPFFAGSFKNRIKSEKLNTKAAELNLQFTKNKISTQWIQNLAAYQNNKEIFENYKQAAKDADDILITSSLQLQQGEINFINYVYLVNNAISILSAKADAEKNLNQTIIELKALSNNF
ncbi:MAG: CusA/CzcA family heavy metal efflux RND transporter [Bacteroidia bacterium]